MNIKLTLAALASALALSACGGTLEERQAQCETAQTNLSRAVAALVIFQENNPGVEVPAQLQLAIDTAEDLLPLFCPTPTTVVVAQ